MKTKHYVCMGRCGGISQNPVVCQAKDCDKYDQNLTECVCEDSLHKNLKTKKLWFKRKTYGWGWTPATWQGWISVLIYIILVFFFSLKVESLTSQEEIILKFILPVVFLTFILLFISYKKGETPKWQWGESKKEDI